MDFSVTEELDSFGCLFPDTDSHTAFCEFPVLISLMSAKLPMKTIFKLLF